MKTLFGIILIALAVAGGIVFVKPQIAHVESLRAEVATYQGALDKATELKQERERLLGIYNSLDKTQLERLNGMLPRSIDNVKLAIEIEDIASSLGLSLKDIDVQDPLTTTNSRVSVSGTPAQSPYGTAEITFTIVGDYAQFVTFLERIERSLRLIDVRSVKFVAPRGETLRDTYEFDVTVSTYWVRDIEATTTFS